VARSIVPLIDIAPVLNGTDAGTRAVAEQVGRACEEIGFLTVTVKSPRATRSPSNHFRRFRV
jgi:isopenicillin N synthase-like dioxygenase